MTGVDDDRAAAARLMRAAAVRDRAVELLEIGEQDGLQHFAIDMDRLDAAVTYVADVVRKNFPDLNVPFHSRWRHFSVGGRDRWAEIRDRLDTASPAEVGRIQFDLVITSVLLDAGAGESWRYIETASGQTFRRSEGLAVASFELFNSGMLSGDAASPLQADAAGLAALTEQDLGRSFQVTEQNPLVGVSGRTELMRRLATTIERRSDLFGSERGQAARVGNLFDGIARYAREGTIAAPDILGVVLDGFGDLWPGQLMLGGVNLGDTWYHPAVQADDATAGLMPFHKLSQWLTYSLVEPLQEAGITVTDLDGLTGLAEYRNGGLFVDLGLLRPKHDDVLSREHRVDSEIVVEWRALTIALLDRIADPLRSELGQDSGTFPLAKILEGGTWQAGRRIAAERRSGGGPPIRTLSEGTVF